MHGTAISSRIVIAAGLIGMVWCGVEVELRADGYARGLFSVPSTLLSQSGLVQFRDVVVGVVQNRYGG
jgi:hypothetical protein